MQDMGKILSNNVTDKGLISNIYRVGQKSSFGFFHETQINTSPRKTDGQEAHENMLNTDNHQRNANQNYHEVSPHTIQNGYPQKVYKQ